MSIQEEIESIEATERIFEDDYNWSEVEKLVDEVPYENIWSDKESAVNYAKKMLNNSNWKDQYSSAEDAVFDYIVNKKRGTVAKTESPDTLGSPGLHF